MCTVHHWEKNVISHPMYDIAHLEGNPDPGGFPDETGGSQSILSLVIGRLGF